MPNRGLCMEHTSIAFSIPLLLVLSFVWHKHANMGVPYREAHSMACLSCID
jgi:hypothetical protein